MTAINATCDKAGAYFLTDAACYDERNVLMSWKSKVKTFPRLRLGMATSGTRGDGDRIVGALDEMSNYEEAIRQLPALMRYWFENTNIKLFVVVGGWSEERRCGEVHRIATCPYFGLPEPFTLKEESFIFNPPLTPAELLAGGIAKDGRLLVEDSEELLTRSIRAQRHVKFPVSDPETNPYCVGGVAELTTINASGIHQRQVMRWPDKLGEPINPSAVAEEFGSPQTLPRLSRQQRRARR